MFTLGGQEASMTQKPLFLMEPRYSGHMPSAHTLPASPSWPVSIQRDTRAESGGTTQPCRPCDATGFRG